VFGELGIKPFVDKPPVLHAVAKAVADSSATRGNVGAPKVFGSIAREEKE